MTLIDYLLNFREVAGAWLEPNLWWLQILSILISGLFVWGIVHIITKTNYLTMKTELYMNILGAGNLPRYRSIKGWRQILRRLKSEDSQQWKIAVLEADHILNEILKMSGYLGLMDEKLDLITPAQMANIEEVKIAHKIASQIAGDPTLTFSQEAAYQAIEIYRKVFIELNLLSE